MAYKSLVCDGTGSYLSCPLPAIAAGDFTLAFWLKPTWASSFTALPDDSGRHFTNFWTSGDLENSFGNSYLGDTGATVGATGGSWSHYAVTRSGTTLTRYLNGSSVNSQSNAINSTLTTARFGSNPSGGGNNYTGKFADIRMYGAAVSGANVAALAAGTDYTTGLSRHWALTEGAGTTAADTGGSSQDATLTGSGITWDTDIPAALAGGGGGSAVGADAMHHRILLGAGY